MEPLITEPTVAVRNTGYTYATVAIPDAAKDAAKVDFPSYFDCRCADDTQAIFWATSGPFGNDELEQIVNEVEWEHRIVFGNDAQAAMAHLGLTGAPEELQETPAV